MIVTAKHINEASGGGLRGRLGLPEDRWPSASALARLVCLNALVSCALWGQAYFVPGDPKAGMQVFSEKRCMRCHAVLGEGGRAAPDLARTPASHLSSAELVSEMWNHAPAMWKKMRLEKVAPPQLTVAETTNLFAFLYSVRSLDEPGNAERGRRLLTEKNCLECHAIAGPSPRSAPDLKSWAAYRNPVSWVQAMWNHGPAMQAMMAERGIEWPQFADKDMVDLIACIRTLASNPGAREQIRPADAERGRRIFAAKHCSRCHGVAGEGKAGPDLGARDLPRTLGQFAGLMWNHAPQMWSRMSSQGVARPQFSNQEMADLIAYLFTQRYFDPAGKAAQGRRIFAEKGCAGCHSGSGSAPDLRGWRGNTFTFATALWNHGPMMFTRIQERQLEWPPFRPGDVADLLEYLNRGGNPPTAKGQP